MCLYDKFIIFLCISVVVVYGVVCYYDLELVLDDFDLKKWFMGGYDVFKVDEVVNLV